MLFIYININCASHIKARIKTPLQCSQSKLCHQRKVHFCLLSSAKSEAGGGGGSNKHTLCSTAMQFLFVCVCVFLLANFSSWRRNKKQQSHSLTL